MAPHDDDRSAQHDDDLSSLYQQRKQRHPAPERLNEAVLATAKAEKDRQGRGYGWKGALSSVAAAVVILVLGMNWLQDPVLSLSEDVSLVSEMADKEATESAQPFLSELATGEAPPELARSAPAPAPAPKAETRRMEPAESEPSGSDAPVMMADRALPFESVQSEAVALKPRFLKAIAGENSVFEQCDGSVFEYTIPTAPSKGWFEVEWSESGGIGSVVSRGAESPCDSK